MHAILIRKNASNIYVFVQIKTVNLTYQIDLLEMAIHQHHSKMTYIELASRSTGIAAMCLNAADLYDMDKRELAIYFRI